MPENWRIAVDALLDKKARDLKVLDISKLTTITSVFVIVSGTSTTHLKALADNVDEKLGEQGLHPFRLNGYDSARWILMDYGAFVVHLFQHEEREFYDLERLWGDGALLFVHDVN